MLKYILATVLFGAPIAASAAEPVVMNCSGNRPRTDRAADAVATGDIAFQVRIDERARTVVQDGKAMVVRDWSARRIVYSDFNPGLLGKLANGVVITLDRTTGAWRDQWGRGTCKLVQGRRGS